MRIAVLCCAVAGCAYRPGSFHYPMKNFEGTRATLGCLDVAVQRRTDLPIGPVLAYQFGNRCDHATRIDLGAVTVRGRTADGADVVLQPYDPAGEIHPAELDGRMVGAEAIAYPTEGTLAQVCVDLASLAQTSPAQWICLGETPVVGSVP